VRRETVVECLETRSAARNLVNVRVMFLLVKNRAGMNDKKGNYCKIVKGEKATNVRQCDQIEWVDTCIYAQADEAGLDVRKNYRSASTVYTASSTACLTRYACATRYFRESAKSTCGGTEPLPVTLTVNLWLVQR